jgi:hypothetical protein
LPARQSYPARLSGNTYTGAAGHCWFNTGDAPLTVFMRNGWTDVRRHCELNLLEMTTRTVNIVGIIIEANRAARASFK